MDDELDAISSLESPCGGIEGGVAVVSRMRSSPLAEEEGSGEVSSSGPKKKRSMPGSGLGLGLGLGSGGVTAEGFARGVHDSWRVGKKDCDNGFLLVASREDRSFAISVVRERTGRSNPPAVCFILLPFVGRSVVRSIGRSFGQPVGRSVRRSVNRRGARVAVRNGSTRTASQVCCAAKAPKAILVVER